MIDAATIGITLALNNGVSDGVAQIRRDLAALDAAVAASSAGLTALVAQGAGLATPARMAAALLPALPQLASSRVPVAVVDSETSPTMAPGMMDDAIVPTRAPAMLPAVPNPVSPGPLPAVAPLPDLAPYGAALAARAEVGLLVGAKSGSVSDEGPAAVPSALSAAPVLPPPLPHFRDTEPGREDLRPPIAPLAPILAAARVPPVAVPPAPAGTNMPGGALPPDGAMMQEVAIYMDGAMIGRFVADHLAETAMRAPAGATAFDPRLSPDWLGLVGAG